MHTIKFGNVLQQNISRKKLKRIFLNFLYVIKHQKTYLICILIERNIHTSINGIVNIHTNLVRYTFLCFFRHCHMWM